MRFVTFTEGSCQSYGILSDGKVLDLTAAAVAAGLDIPSDLVGFIAGNAGQLELAERLLAGASAEAFVSLEAVNLMAPIPSPRKNIFCVGRNYHDHVVEGFRAKGNDVALPKFPQFFTKTTTSVAGPNDDFYHNPALTSRLDYEVELAVVIGKPGRDIQRADAMGHVFGVSVMNDITARDLQHRHDQWFKGKSLDGSAPMGPCIVTLDEIDDLNALELTAHVNGEERQRACVAQMIFDIPEIIMQLSAGTTLEAGDIIATGTPGGVGYAMDPPQFLKSGDVVECTIDGIGQISTRITDCELQS